MVIYTRNATCAPIRAEEGITGLLSPPNSSTTFRDLPEDEQIGGYPNLEQLSGSDIDPALLDSEGRCVILEFPAFVLIGTYCPAERDSTRSPFRTAFLNLLDSRIRNLAKMGKRVVWTGDFNISREEIDTAAAEESMRKNDMDAIEWISTPARRMFNQLLVGGKVHGERDEGREKSILWDLCRGFHEGRKGMYTCWETKVNARPGNYGARIDYVVCSHEIKEWFSDSNIQEGLMGSDHCPVYAVTKGNILIDGVQKHILDLMNPPGMFLDGIRQVEWSSKNLLPMSGKLIQEFDRRRNIRDMFTRKVSIPREKSSVDEVSLDETRTPAISSQLSASSTLNGIVPESYEASSYSSTVSNSVILPITSTSTNNKRSSNTEAQSPVTKRSKSASQSLTSSASSKGQQSLKGFFMAKTPNTPQLKSTTSNTIDSASAAPKQPEKLDSTASSLTVSPSKSDFSFEDEAANFEVRQSWGKLFAKPIAPKCEHNEPCKTMLTKKPGINCGRSFWMCNRPLGPNGRQEKGTQWRCHTFIWASDWDARDTSAA